MDILRSKLLQETTSSIGVLDAAFYLCLAAAMGFYVFLIYRTIRRKNFYNRTFNISLWVLTVVIAAIIVTISRNIVLSLGMVGALSIVRYRTAIKDPMDLVFLFWAIAEGIICGSGMPIMAAMLAVVVTAGLFLLNHMPMVKPMKILSLTASSRKCEDAIVEAVQKYCKHYTVKSKVITGSSLNMVIEFSSEEERACVDALAEIEGILSVSSLTHDGEVTF